MFQKFFVDTLGSRFIKMLLADTPLPKIESVDTGDSIVSGCYYIFQHTVIQCVTSGVLYYSPEKDGTLYPSETLYPSMYLYPGTGYRAATFYVRDVLDTADPRYFETFRSNVNYYDSKTHKYLGKYLRYLKTTKGLNLLPYYNYCDYSSVSDIELRLAADSTVDYEIVSKQHYRIIAVPLLFGKDFNIYLDSVSQVLMRCVIYGADGLVYDTDGTCFSDYDGMRTSYKVLSRASFKERIQFHVDANDNKLVNQEKNLYLLIQLPQNNTTAVVVTQGFTSADHGIICDQNSVRKKQDVYNPSLLWINNNEIYPFADRLIEYLLDNVISTHDAITNNVENVQRALSTLKNDSEAARYKDLLETGRYKYGYWDTYLQGELLKRIDKLTRSRTIFDQDGNVNTDIERYILSVGGRY